MKTIITLLLLVSFCLFAFGQNEISIENKMNGFNTEKNNRSWLDNNFILDYKVAAGTEYFVFPKMNYEIIINELDTLVDDSRPLGISIANFSIDPKINLSRRNKTTSFIKFPTGFAFSVTTKPFYRINLGFFHFHTAALIGIASGLQSNKIDVSKRGYSIGVGIQYLRAPIIGHNVEKINKPYLSDNEDEVTVLKSSRKNYFLPTAQIDYYYVDKYNIPRGFSLSLSAYRAIHIKFSMTLTNRKAFV